MENLAIFAGNGILPQAIAMRHPDALVVSFSGVGIDFEAKNHYQARFEKSGGLFKELRKREINTVCFAGTMSRPELSLWRMDFKTVRMLPQIRTALKNSDGKTLSVIRRLVEQEGFRVVGAQKLMPDWIAPLGQIGKIAAPEMDLKPAFKIHESMSLLDVGQALVMKGSHCWAIETLPGTQAMLEFVAMQEGAKGGFLYKSSKIGQDLDMDMASIGANTVDQVKDAGLKGIYLGARRSLVLDMPNVINKADQAGIYLVGV